MAIWTNVGLNLVASGIQSAGANCAITFVAISPGCGTLASAITATTVYTSLTLDANVPVNLASGQSLTITDGTNSETVTTSGAVTAGTTAVIPINSWTAAHSYAAHTSGVCPTPAASDLALYNESVRVAANIGSAGAAAGESLDSGYFDGTQPTAIYLLVGYFGGSTATSTLGTGTLMVEDIQLWNHVVNTDSNMYQADTLI